MVRRHEFAVHPGPVDRTVTAVLARRPHGPRARRWRRVAALALVILAGTLALADRREQPTGTPVLEVAADLPLGTVLTSDQVATVRARAPDGALTDPAQAIGRVLAGPVRRGELLTDARLVPTDGPDPGPGRVAVPIVVQDPALLALLRPGMRVAVLGLPAEGAPALLSDDALVISVAEAIEGRTDRPIVLGIPDEAADTVVAASLVGRVAFRFS